MAALSQVWRQIEYFYFEAMINCIPMWTKAHNGPLPGYKMVSYESGNLTFVDFWSDDTNATKVCGTANILRKNEEGIQQAIWYIQYNGNYPHSALPLLKESLYESCLRKEFCGARGPNSLRQGSFEYWNYPTFNSFVLFEGWEKVVKRTPEAIILGQHKYTGGMLRDIR